MALWPDTNGNGRICELADLNREIILAAAAEDVVVEPIRAPYWRKKFVTRRLRCRGNTCHVVTTCRRACVFGIEYWQFDLRSIQPDVDYLFLCVIDALYGFFVFVVSRSRVADRRVLTVPILGPAHFNPSKHINWLELENAYNTIESVSERLVS